MVDVYLKCTKKIPSEIPPDHKIQGVFKPRLRVIEDKYFFIAAIKKAWLTR
tara:strand:- start:403 stop:555 length:153 start_codon:yes stop_codon:yes gene_type:complete